MNFDQSLKDSLSQIIKERLDPLFERLSLIETKITRIEEIVFKQQGEKIDSISNQLQSIESKIEILQNELCDKNSLQDTQDVQKEQNNQQCSQAENQVQQNSENNANTETVFPIIEERNKIFPQQTPQIELQPLFQFQQEKSTLFFPSIKQNEFPENQSNKLINEFPLQRNQQDPQVDQDKKNLFGIQNSNSNMEVKQNTLTSVNKNSSTYLDTMEFLNFLHQSSGASSQKITDSVDNLQNNFRSNQDNHQKNLQPQTSTIHQPQQNQQICLYTTRTGTKCHVEGCKWLRYSKIPISQEQANLMTQCQTCRRFRKYN